MVNGQPEKRKCLHLNTKRLVAGTGTNATEEKSKVPQKLDQAEVENEEWETVHAGSESNRGKIFTVSRYQGLIASGVCGHHKSQAESYSRR